MKSIKFGRKIVFFKLKILNFAKENVFNKTLNFILFTLEYSFCSNKAIFPANLTDFSINQTLIYQFQNITEQNVMIYPTVSYHFT